MRLDVGLNGLCGPDSEAVIEAWEITPSDPRPDVGA
jgi:hypothetical protein